MSSEAPASASTPREKDDANVNAEPSKVRARSNPASSPRTRASPVAATTEKPKPSRAMSLLASSNR